VKAADAPKTGLISSIRNDQSASPSQPELQRHGRRLDALARQALRRDFFTKPTRKKPQVGRSIDDAVTVLNSGERMVALGAASTALRSAAKGQPIAVIYPTTRRRRCRALRRHQGLEEPNAGKLFLDFMLSAEYSRW